MSVFVDTGVFYAHADTDASRHRSAYDALDRVLQGEFGRPFSSDYVYDETTTLARSRSGDFELARTVGRRIRGVSPFPEVVELVFVTEDAFASSVAIFERYDDQSLSFTDATTIALVRHHDIDTVLSFDDDFDGLVDRTDPREL